MGDDADELAVLTEPRQCFQRRFQGVFVEGAESFIEKKRIDPDVPAGHLGKAEGQGQAHDKAFAAGEVLGGADLSGLVVVDDVQLQGLLLVADQEIAVRHLPQPPVGMGRHHLERQPLGKIPEFLPVGRTDELVQLVPAGAFLLLKIDRLQAFLLAALLLLISGQNLVDAADIQSQLFQFGIAGRDLFRQRLGGLIR